MDASNEEIIMASERHQILEHIKDLMEPFITVLGFVWLLVILDELIWGSSPITQPLVWLIWGIFLVDFLIRLAIAPDKLAYIKTNWLGTISILIPAFRMVHLVSLIRFFRAAHTVRSLQLLRIVSGLKRGMRTLPSYMHRKQFGYVLALTAITTLIAAAGMMFFETGAPGGGFESYWDAFYWTGMMVTTLGSGYTPQTAEGRVLALMIALYAFAMLGYFTATLATFFIGRGSDNQKPESAVVQSNEQLQAEIAALRRELREVSEKIKP